MLVWIDTVRSKYIGKGNTAYTALSFLEADVFALTSAGKSMCCRFRRSPGVKKYVHIVHAVGDIHTYKFYSFDYYDAVFCSGPGQAESLRRLEELRGRLAKIYRFSDVHIWMSMLHERSRSVCRNPVRYWLRRLGDATVC